MIPEKKLNVSLVKRLLSKCNNMDSLLNAYNNTSGVEKLAKSTMYKKLNKYGISTDFEIGAEPKSVKATCIDKVLSGISLDRRLYSNEKPAVREVLGFRCSCCGTNEGLEIDHIDGNRYNTQINNLQLLCGTCHNKKTWGEQTIYTPVHGANLSRLI